LSRNDGPLEKMEISGRMSGRGTYVRSSPELSRRREAVVSALAQKGWAAQAHVSARARFGFARLIFHHALGNGGRGELPRRLRNTGRCALTASRKTGPPVPAAFSLAPQLRFQSNASRRCANPRTGRSQLSTSGGPKFSN